LISRAYYTEPLPASLIYSEPRALAASEIDALWEIFTAINRAWSLFHTRDPAHPVLDASNLRSTWLEFVRLRAESTSQPSYVGEYENAIRVVAALRAEGDGDPFERLFFDRDLVGASPNAHEAAPMSTRAAHAKDYVVDEFISVMVIASGFKEFGGRNYNGFLGGSRFNRVTKIAAHVDLPIPGVRS